MNNLRFTTSVIGATATLLSASLIASSAPQRPAASVKKAAASPARTATVKIDNFSFTPAALTVAAGTQVTWANGDDVPHTVVNPGGHFKSLALDTGDKFTYTFRVKGTYPYFCSVHPMMTAKVIVR